MAGVLLVMGEALMDLIEGTDDRGSSVYRPRFGGSPLNVAVGSSRLGAIVELISALGLDSFGKRIGQFLAAEGVGTTYCVDVATTCLAFASQDGPHVRYEFFGDPRLMLELPTLPEELLGENTIVHAGSTAVLDAPARDRVGEVFSMAKSYRTIDPNPRPLLINDVSAYRASLTEILGHSDLIKLSAEDAEFLDPLCSPAAMADRLHQLGGATVVLTQAASPTLLWHDGELTTVDVNPILPMDSTGAGDSFMASILSDIACSPTPTTLEEWVRLLGRANVAAGITCMRVGGAESMPTRAELDAAIDDRGSVRQSLRGCGPTTRIRNDVR
ncbi:hypothetical protein F1C58_04135 [Glaciihabitans sp. INWT7]|uniref:carbohydrate kinase family protein n=1 Tax=Glaciihabitans sp. INWT7 TaxID=2596912 RepID=UPI0016268FBF|nr:PfkB family carbohydrate kinase [Glaciihabitans sp. INWT7]QNE46180.1 hypothetical protein F1C58_04135 [Glaciihabitans sp. INWT7]